jgi:hypothetical protein
LRRETNGDLDVDGRVMLKLILKKYDIRMWVDRGLYDCRHGPVTAPCENGNELSDYITVEKFLYRLNNY